MKCLTRYLSVFCCFLLLFSICSVPVSAETLTNKPYHVYVESEWGLWSTVSGSKIVPWAPFVVWPSNGEADYYHGTWTPPEQTNSVTLTTNYTFANNDNTIFFSGDNTAKITIENIREYFSVDGYYLNEPHHVGGYIKYIDGTQQYISPVIIPSGDKYSVQFTVTAEKDVSQIVITSVFDSGLQLGLYGPWTTLRGEIGEVYDQEFALRIELEDKEVGLLGGIWNSITSGFQSVGNWFGELGGKITSGFESLGNGISNVFNAIKDLPAKIWEFIENGLKSLFVPDEEYMTSYKDKWDSLLADRLGAVYQVVQITFGAWEDIQTADQMDTINIPVVTIPLLEGQEFSFGGYDVKIVPDGFDVLVTGLKSIVGIVCTIMFINGLRKRYDEIMGVEQ